MELESRYLFIFGRKENKLKGAWVRKGNEESLPFLKVLDISHAFLSIGYHLCEQVCEAGATELGRACAVQVSIVDGFAV